MALENGSGVTTTMPVIPMGGGYGNGFGDFGGGWMWIIVLFILLGGWGGNFGGGFGGNDIYPWMNQSNQISSGFANQANGLAISGLQSAVTSGFGDVQTALCGGFAGVNAGIANGFAQAEIANNARQMADLQQQFALQSALQNCCCENRLATANLTSVVQQENCADRAAIADGLRDVLVAQTAGVQKILDTMCQDKIDAKNEKIAELQNKLNMANFAASQSAQDNYIQNALTAQTQYFLAMYPPTPVTSAAPAT